MEHAKHIIRAVLLLVIATVTFIFVRHFAVPSTYGMYGAYRYASVGEYAEAVPVHGHLQACNECHEDEADLKAEGKHASVSCAVCHGPVVRHVSGDEVIAPMPVNRNVEWCAMCHQRLTARPKTFPQVDIADHLTQQGISLNEASCLECHDAHNPAEPPEEE